MDDAVDGGKAKSPKTTRQAVQFALSLLSPADRRKYYMVAGAQVFTSFLDMAGVLLIGVLGLIAASGVQDTPYPAPLQSVLDAVGLADESPQTVAGIVAITAAVLLLGKSLASAFLMRRIFRFLGTRQAQISTQLTRKVLALPLLSIEKRPSQETAYAITSGVSTTVMNFLGSAALLVSEVALLVVLGVTLLFVNAAVTIVAFVFFALLGFGLQKGLAARATSLGSTIGRTAVKGQQNLQEALAAYREIQVLGRRQLFIDAIAQQWGRSGTAMADNQFLQQIPKLAYEAALVLGAVALAAWQFATTTPVDAIATLAIFVAAGSRILPSMLRLNGLTLGMKYGVASAAVLFPLVEELDEAEAAGELLPEVAAGANLRDVDRRGFDAHVSVADISVTYPGSGEPALTEVSLDIPAGTRAAIVGTTGAGKSTLADVILGVLAPQSGTVLIGDLTPSEAIATWPSAIAYVPQSVSMMNGSVRANVALGLPADTVDDAHVWKALELAQLDAFLRESRDGLDTIVGERGVRLSGGQRQRLGLARALYGNPAILVLDEATSALDAETETLVADTLAALSHDVTVITIAHRLATVREADIVVYLEGGRIVARGSFDEVRELNTAFDHQAALLGL